LFLKQSQLSLQNTGSPSVYGEIRSQGEREEKELNATDGFEIESFDKVQTLANEFQAV
jgi:hypothetical protein